MALQNSLDQMGSTEEALKHYGISVRIREKILGKSNPLTALTLENMACIKRDSGDFESALSLQVLSSLFLVPTSRALMSSICRVEYWTLERHIMAHLISSTPRQSSILVSLSHTHTQSLNVLTHHHHTALIVQAKRDFKKAIRLYERSVALHTRILGSTDSADHPLVAEATKVGFRILNRASLSFVDSFPHITQNIRQCQKFVK